MAGEQQLLTQADLDRVSQAAEQAASARAELYKRIRAAAKKGHSLREIAAAADLSHEQVRRMIRP